MSLSFVVVADFLNAEECAQIITEHAHQAVEIRDDSYSVYWRNDYKDPVLRQLLLEKIRGRGMTCREISNRICFTAYQTSGFIASHVDGHVALGGAGESQYTVLIYLTDDYEGGELVMETLGLTMKPKRGTLLLMAQDLPHHVTTISRGYKCLVRTDMA